MATFEDLQQAYVSSPTELFAALDGLSQREQGDLLLAGLARGLRKNRVESEEAYGELPREFRRGTTRWDHYDYLLHWFDQEMMQRHVESHLAANDPESVYLRNGLALLVWKSIDTGQAQDEGGYYEQTEFAAEVEAEREEISGAEDAAFIAADGEGEPEITDEEEDANGEADTVAPLTRKERRAQKKARR